MTNAWAVTTGSTNVVVAVIDTGITYNHQDLAGNMWRNPGETGMVA
jgi:subtilisin family serine protease